MGGAGTLNELEMMREDPRKMHLHILSRTDSYVANQSDLIVCAGE